MELHEFHVLHGSFGTIYHCNAVACCYKRVCRCLVNGTAASCCHERNFAKEGINLIGCNVQHVCSVALYVGCLACHLNSQMMLGKYLDCKMVVENCDVRVLAHGFDKRLLNLGTGIVGMVQNAEFRMSSFTVKVELAVFVLVEIDSPVYKGLYLRGGFTDNLFHSIAVAYPVACNHGVLDMFLKVIYLQVRYRCNTTLCKIGVCIL